MNGESKAKDILNTEKSEVINNHQKTVQEQCIIDSPCSKSDLGDMVSDGSKQKKSLFQITGIVKNDSNTNQKLSEVVESMSDSKVSLHINGSLSDESLKSIDATDGNLMSSLSKTSQQPIRSHDSSRLGNLADVQTSRFKVVRIASHRKPVVRGRWSCKDFEFDKPNQNHYIQGPAAKLPKTTVHQTGGSGDDKPASNDSGSEGSSLMNSIYFVQSGDEDPTASLYNTYGMVYTNGHLTLDNILTDNHSSGYSSATVVQSAEALAEHPFGFNAVPDCSANPLDPNSSEVAGIPELSDAEACAAANSMCALDNKIEQAMDLVKSHLMFAVHEEVEQLKEQIKDLMIRRSILEQENSILRASATPETLAKLKTVGGGTRTPDAECSLDEGSNRAEAAVLL